MTGLHGREEGPDGPAPTQSRQGRRRPASTQSRREGSMAQAQQTMQYGLWPSPIGPQSLAEGLRLADVAWDSDGETLVWLEGRSDRGVLVCLPPGGEAPRDVTPELSVRARV